MNKFTTVLAATDFSADGNNAVRRAAMLAHEHGARLHIVHVLGTTGFAPLRDWLTPPAAIELQAAQARSALRRLAVEISGSWDLSPSLEVVAGDPFATLLQKSERTDLVVLGRRGQGRLGGLLAGTTVDRLLRSCRRPILVVRTPVEQPYRRVLVPVDFSASSDAALRVATRIRREIDLHLFHAIQSRREAVLRESYVPEHVIRRTRRLEEAGIHARLRRKVASLGLDGASMSVALAHGPAARSTVRHAETLGADLIVAGRHGRSTVGGFLLDRVINRVLSDSACDLLIVPRPSGDATPDVAATPLPRPAPVLPTGAAAHAAGRAARPGAPAPAPWIHNTARFLPRRS